MCESANISSQHREYGRRFGVGSAVAFCGCCGNEKSIAAHAFAARVVGLVCIRYRHTQRNTPPSRYVWRSVRIPLCYIIQNVRVRISVWG